MSTSLDVVGGLLEKARGGSQAEKARPRAERLAEAAQALAGEVVAGRAAEAARGDLVAMVDEMWASGQMVTPKTKDIKPLLVRMIMAAQQRPGVAR